jgi:hypothetical protein
LQFALHLSLIKMAVLHDAACRYLGGKLYSIFFHAFWMYFSSGWSCHAFAMYSLKLKAIAVGDLFFAG